MIPARCSTLAVLGLLTSFATAQLQPQAIYPLQVDLLDATATYGPIMLYGTTPPSPPANGICLNGIYLFGATPNGQDIRTPVISTLNTSDFQFDVEFSITGLGPNNRPVVMGGHSYRWLGIYVQPNGTIGLKHNNSNYAWSTSTTVVPGTWYTGTVKYEMGTVELYVDGALALQAVVGPLNTSTNLNFCTNDYSNGAAFYGCVRNLRIYNDTTLGTTAGVFAYGSGCDGLTYAANGVPSLGNPLFELVASNVPAVSPLAFFAFGSSAVNPGTDLTVIGMAGCASYTSFDLGLFGPSVVVGGSANLALPIPADPALTGTALATQAVSFSAANPLGLATSNGLRLVLAP
jgi:hypothetical protein